jgi:hypothetical protein
VAGKLGAGSNNTVFFGQLLDLAHYIYTGQGGRQHPMHATIQAAEDLGSYIIDTSQPETYLR